MIVEFTVPFEEPSHRQSWCVRKKTEIALRAALITGFMAANGKPEWLYTTPWAFDHLPRFREVHLTSFRRARRDDLVVGCKWLTEAMVRVGLLWCDGDRYAKIDYVQATIARGQKPFVQIKMKFEVP